MLCFLEWMWGMGVGGGLTQLSQESQGRRHMPLDSTAGALSLFSPWLPGLPCEVQGGAHQHSLLLSPLGPGG